VDDPGSRDDDAGVADGESVLIVELDSNVRRSASIGGGGGDTADVGVAGVESVGVGVRYWRSLLGTDDVIVDAVTVWPIPVHVNRCRLSIRLMVALPAHGTKHGVVARRIIIKTSLS
jgi:hypothetical protein